MSLYQYKGALTVDVEAEHERELEFLRQAEHRAWQEAEAARREAQKFADENARLRQALAEVRYAKKKLQSRVIGLKRIRPIPTTVRNKVEQIDAHTYGGPHGLAAAAEEIAAYNRRKKAA